MKKITILLFCLLSLNVFSQISISEDFNASTSLPSGWTASRYSGTATQACNGNSFRSSLYSGTSSSTGWLSSPNYTSVSNGQNAIITFDYKVVDYAAATNATPAGWGNLQVQISQDNGASWVTQFTINDSNHTVSNVCANKSFTIPAASVPNASNFKLRFLSTWTAGDYYFYIDNVNASQSASVPNCNALMTTPINLATNVSETTNLNWSAASGFPTGYVLKVGTTSGGTQIVNNVNVGNVTFYDLPILAYSTTYYVTITPYNGNGNATGCTQYSFTTNAAPPIGNVCENPIIISSLPYNTTDNTSNYADDYSGGQGSNCGSNTQFYLDGDDVVYRYTATTTGFININLTPTTGSDIYSGIFIYANCADIGTNCLAGVANGTSNLRTISQFPITNGQSYYIVISSYPSPQSVAYTLNIQLATCTNPTATYTIVPACTGGNTQFYINTNVTSFGSATSVTVSDNLGSTPVSISSLGSVQLGPFQNSTSALIYVTNNQDNTCVLTSPFTTQSNCPPANDNCSGAIDLIAGSSFTQNEITSANYGALASSVPNPGCTGSVFLDVWYKVTVPSSGNITLETKQEPGGLTDTGMALYSGTCASLTLLQCDNDSSSDPLHAKIALTGRTPGEIIYVRIWDFGGNDFSLFRISAYDCSLGVAAPTGTANQSFCSGATVSNLTATGTSIKWYSTSTGGTQLLGTQALVNGTSYYASQTVSSCESATRFQVIATVTTASAPTGTTNQSFCSGATVSNLSATGTLIKWYSASTGGTQLLGTQALVNGTSYYASQTVSSCESATRFQVIATVTTASAPTGTTNQTFCSGATVSNLSATGTTIKWYSASTGGTQLLGTQALVNGTSYYASQTISSCESATRFQVITTVTTTSAPTGIANQTFCNGATVSNLTATGTAIKWYSSSTGGTQLLGTQALVNGTNYYASQTVSSCESATRFQVIASVTAISATPTGNANQTIPVANANDATLANLVVNPSSVLWYATLTDAQNQTNPLLLSTIVTDGSTYYSVNNATGCPSTPFGVTVTVVLSNEFFKKDNFTMYPVPVDEILYLKNDTPIQNLRIINLMGKEVLNKSINLSEVSLDLSQLESGTYMILLDISDVIKSIKFIKK